MTTGGRCCYACHHPSFAEQDVRWYTSAVARDPVKAWFAWALIRLVIGIGAPTNLIFRLVLPLRSDILAFVIDWMLRLSASLRMQSVTCPTFQRVCGWMPGSLVRDYNLARRRDYRNDRIAPASDTPLKGSARGYF